MDIHSSTVFNHLDREWERLVSTRQLDRALARWQADAPLAEFRDVAALIDLLSDRAADCERQSEVLLALLRQAPNDPLAARLVLQRFVPALKTIAAWQQPLPQVDWSGMVVAAGFEVIATYPVERRPGRVAANIMWDVRKQMYATLAEHRRCQRELAAGEPDEEPLDADVAECFEASDLLRWAAVRSRVPRDVARLIVLTRSIGVPLEEVAADRGIPSARLRQRRWRSEQRMREALAEAS